MAQWKYYIKIQTGPKTWRYFYSKEEYQAYLNNKAPKKAQAKQNNFVTNVINSGKSFFSKLGSSVSNAAKTVTSAVSKKASEVTSTLSKTAKDLSKTISKASKKASATLNQTISSIKKTSSDLLKNGKDIVERTFKYIAKVGEGAKARYFYTKEEYEAYLNAGKDAVNKLYGNAMDTVIDVGAKAVSVILNGAGSTLLKEAVGFSGADLAMNVVSDLISKLDKPKKSTSEPKSPSASFTPATPAPKESLPLAYNKQEKEYTSDENAKMVNPHFNSKWDDPNYEFTSMEDYEAYQDYANNCIACSVTYDLRERGYDVEVRPLSDYSHGEYNEVATTLVEKMYDDPETITYENRGCDLTVESDVFGNVSVQPPPMSYSDRQDMCKGIEDQLSQQENSRGELHFWYADSTDYMGGHSVAYEVENGTVYVRDTQRNERVTMDSYINDRSDYIGNMAAVRLDNAEPTEATQNWVKNR